MATYKQKQRERYATVEKDGKPAYPIGDKVHARLALSQINRGGLSSGQKAEVRAEAHKMLGPSAGGKQPPASAEKKRQADGQKEAPTARARKARGARP